MKQIITAGKYLSINPDMQMCKVRNNIIDYASLIEHSCGF